MRIAIPDTAFAICDTDASRLWLLCCAATAAAAHWVLATGTAGAALPHPMVLLAILALAADLAKLPRTSVSTLDGLCFGAAMLACMLPFRSSASLAMALAGAIALRGGGVSGRSGAVVLFALAGWGLKDGVWAGFASIPVMWAESHVVALALQLCGIATTAIGNHLEMADGSDFIILRACSVLSLAYPCMVGTYALSRMVRPQSAVGPGRMALALGLLMLINTGRLVAMVISPTLYHYLHDDTGVVPLQITWGLIVLIAALPRWRRT